MDDVAGWITIGTKMDTSKFDKQYEQLVKKSKEQEIKINAQIENIDNVKNQIGQLEKEFDNLASDSDLEKVARYLELDTKGIKNLTNEEAQEWYVLSMNTEAYEEINKQINDKAFEIEQANNRLEQENEKLKELKRGYNNIQAEIKFANEEKEKFTQGQFLGSIKNQIDNTGKSIQRVIKQTARWGLAIFGIRSAYLFVRQAMSTLSSYNEQIATDLQYIRFALASTMQPVIEYIIKLVITLLQYLGYVVKQLFDINIFKNSGVDKFQKGMANSAKSAKEIKNQLAGFDEMNVLQDTSGGAEETGGGVAPSVDFSKLEGQEVPKWLDTIVEVGKWILDNWEDVVFTLLLVKLFIDLLTGNWVGVIIDLIGLLIIAFKKIWENVKGIIDIIEPYWKAFIEYINNSINNLIGGFNKFKDKVINIWTIIRDKIKGMLTDLRKWLTNNFGLIGTAIGNAISNSIKSIVNAVLRTAENFLNSPIIAVNSLINKINALPGVNLKRLSTFNFPRLAKGGIINYPSRGVPIGGAIGGESGKEGVIPLTNSQQMALLGEAIGKYITINATVVNSMNGRVISREIQRVQNENNFALNR